MEWGTEMAKKAKWDWLGVGVRGDDQGLCMCLFRITCV